MTAVDNYIAEKEKARIIKKTIEHNFSLAILQGEEALKQDGLVDSKRLNDTSGRELYVAAFKECALRGAKEITKGVIPAGTNDPYGELYLMRAAYNVTVQDVSEALEEFGEQADQERIERKFYRNLNERKSDHDDIVYGTVKMSDKDQILDRVDPENAIFKSDKIKQAPDLVAILEEFYRNKTITPTFVDLMKRKNRDLFL